jgi:hypothetical protein
MEVYSNQIQQNTALRLSHRFSKGPLSNLPQEILDTIISTAHEMGKDAIRSRWTQNYLCFQGPCTRGYHYQPYGSSTTELWRKIFVDDWDFHAGSPKDPANNTDEEKADMLEEYIDEDEFQSFEEEMWEIHDERQCV